MSRFYDVQQNSEEWSNLRARKITSSKLKEIMANSFPVDKKTGKKAFKPSAGFGEPAKKYAVELAIEQLNQKKYSNQYSNDHMNRGHEQEPLARALYEQQTFCDVKNGGFFCDDLVGCSPDGLVDSDGLIEIKSHIPPAHFANIKRQDIDPAYKWQCYGNLLITGRDWLDYISFCEWFPKHKQIFVVRVFSENLTDEFEKIQLRISEFSDLIQTTKETIINNDYFVERIMEKT